LLCCYSSVCSTSAFAVINLTIRTRSFVMLRYNLPVQKSLDIFIYFDLKDIDQVYS
jgi:hypothetical protein